MSNEISFAGCDRSEHPRISESRPGQFDLCTRARVNLFILGALSAVLCSPLLPSALFFSKSLICVALQRDRCARRVEPRIGKRCPSWRTRTQAKRRKGGRERERSARAAMRRWLRHHHGVRRISCEPGNTSQLTAGRTVGRARARRGVAVLRLCDNQYSAPPPSPPLAAPRAARSHSVHLSDLPLGSCVTLYRVSIDFTRLFAKSLIPYSGYSLERRT